MNWFRCEGHSDFVLTLHIQPGAKRTEPAGLHGDAMKIKLAAAPVEGKANLALLKYLADCFEVPRHQVVLKQGEKSRRKVVIIKQSKHSPDSLFEI
ncbi:MAG: YggU family protein [Nitrosomonas sp.]|nr:YggU family protein [Nitrosomonas sp.]